MQNARPKKDTFVTLILTESTTSLLKLSLPHLEHLHPDNSNVCLITPSEYSYFQKVRVKSTSKGEGSDLNSGSSKEGNDIEEIYLKISSDVALFSKSSCSSNSCMYEYSDEDILEDRSSTLTDIFEARKIHTLPLLSARSVAHANKLRVHSNDIFVSLIESGSNSTTAEYICRICHGGESLDDLLTPCRCRGSIALVHLKCLERWLKESNHSSCELCQHHYKIVREPQYKNIPWSVFVFLRHPGPHLREIIWDVVGFSIYTPFAIASTYILMMICDTFVKSNVIQSGTLSSHIIACSAIFGMAAIDFTYSSWLLMTVQRHIETWRKWNDQKSTLKVVLPKIKLRPHRMKK